MAPAGLAPGASASVTFGTDVKACGYHRHETGAPLGEIRVGMPSGGGREY
jgi:hypothetical protein